jgi:hypothetical protein
MCQLFSRIESTKPRLFMSPNLLDLFYPSISNVYEAVLVLFLFGTGSGLYTMWKAACLLHVSKMYAFAQTAVFHMFCCVQISIRLSNQSFQRVRWACCSNSRCDKKFCCGRAQTKATLIFFFFFFPEGQKKCVFGI